MKKLFTHAFLLSLLIFAFGIRHPKAQVNHIVISQVYGGGGNSGATYTNDFIELFNSTASTLDLTGWSVQYASSTGSSWAVTNLSGSIAPGSYYLVQEAQGSGGTTPLPAPDAAGTIALSGTNGKVALVSDITALTGTCPAGGTVVDFVGFGSANCFEGTGATPALSNTTAALRNNNGCTDADDNVADFTIGAPSPRNSASPTNVCGIITNTISITAGTDAAEPATTGSFTINFSAATTASTDINFSFAGTATFGTDYIVNYSTGTTASTNASGTLTVPSGTSSVTITITPIDDALIEGIETISLDLSSPTGGYTLGTSSAGIYINDDDFSTVSSPIVINEVYGGGGNSGADYKNDFIELYNQTNVAVDLTGWSVQYASSSGSSWQVTPLSGTIQPMGYYLIQEGAGAGGTTDLPTPDATGGIAMSGTNGKVALVSNSTALSGTCPGGLVDEVGYGTANCFEGGGAAPGLSNTTSDERSPKGFDSDNNNTDFVAGAPTPKNSVLDLIPPTIFSLTPVDDAAGVLTSFTASITFSENIQKGTGTIVLKKITDGSVVNTFDVTTPAVSVTGTTVTFDINSLAFNTGYYFEISAGAFVDLNDNAFAGITGAAGWNFTTYATPPAGTLETTYSFDNCTGSLTDGFTQFNILGAQVWGCSAFGRDAANPPSGNAPNGLEMNGYANGIDNANEDWLISPSFDLTSTAYPLLSLWSRTAYAGATLQLKVSTDYTGTGDPNLATWTDINGKFPSEVSDVWALSQDINLSAYKSAHTYFAFVYTSTTDDGARWSLDDILLTNSATPPPPSLTLGATDIQYTFVANGSSSDKSFTFTGNDLTGNVTLNSTGAFLISKDGSAFTSALNYTAAAANDIPETVYVRFIPGAANQSFIGLITINTPGTAPDTINLKGSSIDPLTTLEVVNWNMEWFGSTTLGPTDDNLQQQNASAVLNTIGADIYGLVEVVDEARLQAVVNSLNATYGAGTYNYIICNYGSHVNPPEPNGSPLSEVQKEAFIYKTALFSNITTRPLIFDENVNSPSYNYWSSGRYPFLMTADVTLNCVTSRINFVLIHAKANTAPTATAYARRKAASDELHDTLMTYFPNDKVIILGDFNDDLDQSITAGFTTTSYDAFTTDTTDFFSPTLALSLAGKKSTVSYNDVIDHVMISNEMKPYYLPGSVTILTDVASLINKYGTTTTDHYPVFTRYTMPNTITPVVISCTPAVVFCSATDSAYTIPAFIATDDCYDAISYSYTISGATKRNGTTNDASGTFSAGTSTIVWTATDSWGNAANCSTSVKINQAPAINIADAYALPMGVDANTVYIGYSPAAALSVTAIATPGTPPYTYSWAAGPGLSIAASTTTAPTVQVSATGSGKYSSTLSVTVTDSKGCVIVKTITIHVKDVRGGNKNNKVEVCHNGHTITISANAVQAHLNHGDQLGSCAGTHIGNKLFVLLKCLLSNFPNPFHAFTTIQYGIPLDCWVSIKIYNVFGQEITTLFDGNKKAGSYTVDFDASKLSKGIYYCKVTAVSSDQSTVQTILLLAQ